MLPFAGGNSYSYKNIIKFVPAEIIIICPELPGRGLLSDKPFITEITNLADYIFIHWISKLPEGCKYIIFGHSMGALLGYLLTCKISATRITQPVRLIVSGRQGPQFLSDREILHTLPKVDFWNKVRELGGMPEELLADELLMKYFEPILRADFKAVESYQHVISPKFNIPIGVFYGHDEGIPIEGINSWNLETTRRVEQMELLGNHFFIFDHPKIIADYLVKWLVFYIF